MNRLFLFYTLIFTTFCWSQAHVGQLVVDYGIVKPGPPPYADITIPNNGKGRVYVLRVEQSPDVVHKLNSDLVLPDSTLIIRIQVNPKKKGPFSYITKVYMSDSPDPVQIRLTGTAASDFEPNYNGMQACPDFGKPAPKTQEPSDLTIITIDKDTKEPLSKSTVSIIRNGSPSGAWITGKDGSFKENAPPGYFYFIAAHDGYFPLEAGIYVGPENSEITIPLKKDPTKVPEKEPEAVAELPQELSPAAAQTIIDKHFAAQRSDSVIRKEMPELANVPFDNFDATYFKPVNVVFVLDVSSSMKQGEKMNLMKYALNQLVGSMREEDHIALITYAEQAEILLEPTTGDQQEVIKERVSELKPEGLTAGGRGIKLGYKQAMKQFAPDKANMVIIITDGAFNKNSDDYQKVVRKYAETGITFSVVGIQNRNKEEAKMREAARFGNGRYIPIAKLSDAQHNLLQEIRIASFKGTGK